MQSGNALFQRGQYSKAAKEYGAGLALAQADQAALIAVLHCNRAAALHALGAHMDALADCFAAAARDPEYLRALQRRADIYTAVGDHHSAMQARALSRPPSHRSTSTCFRMPCRLAHAQPPCSHLCR